MAKVYGLYNQTRRQRYYGKTRRSLKARAEEHSSGQVQATESWNWDKERVIIRTIAAGLTERQATRKAHALERRKPPPGWKTIQTGGP